MLNREYFRDFYYKKISNIVYDEVNLWAPFDRALHIECDNGRMIEFIQANEIHGIDSSEIQSVPIVKRIDVPDKVYDLILLSEKDYSTYTKEQIYEWTIKSAARIVAIIGSDEYMNEREYKFGNLIINKYLTSDRDIKIKIYEFDESLRLYE